MNDYIVGILSRKRLRHELGDADRQDAPPTGEL
jgi:hypothetical protein